MENKPLITVRNFQGYYQNCECREVNGKASYTWVFYVCGFSHDSKHASVLCFDGSKAIVPINDKDEILIRGKRYGRNFWNH